jgi:hypothetical protein
LVWSCRGLIWRGMSKGCWSWWCVVYSFTLDEVVNTLTRFRLWLSDGSWLPVRCPPSFVYNKVLIPWTRIGILKALMPNLNYISCLAISACLTPTDPIISAAIIGSMHQSPCTVP